MLCNVRGNYFPEVLYAFLSEARDLYEEDGDELIVMDVTVSVTEFCYNWYFVNLIQYYSYLYFS